LIRNYLPSYIYTRLWGDRKRWGLTPDVDDPCWKEWEHSYDEFYNANQRQGVGTKVNDAGYRVMNKVDLTGKRVLEIGAGDIRHSCYWKGEPSEYVLVDVSSEMMSKAKLGLEETGVPCREILLERGELLPVESGTIDVVVSFFSLEHLYPLQPYLTEINRVLRHGGTLIGAIPAEGGVAWGLGRALTSRRWFKKNSSIDPDKIICWEHPNFADEIVRDLGLQFQLGSLDYWPLLVPYLDVNLVIRFVYEKS